MSTTLTKIAPDLFRISTYVPEAGIQRALGEFTSGPLAVPIPYTQDTEPILHGLADLEPRTIATHHESAFVGDGRQALRDLVVAIKEVGRWVEVPGPAVQSAEDLKGAPDALPSEAIDLGDEPGAEGGAR